MGFTVIQVMAMAGLWSFFKLLPAATNPSCEFHLELEMGREYFINNNEYPMNYPASTSCTWYITSQPSTKIIIVCDEINFQTARNCADDKLSISLSGDRNFQDAKIFSRYSLTSLVTHGNTLAVGLFATTCSNGGKFKCSMTTIQDPDAITSATPDCSCGWQRVTRITGGRETLPNEYPAMAGLVDVSVKTVLFGGTIISSRYVLTVAHGLLVVQQMNLGVLVGDHNISSGFDTVAAALYKVSSIDVHPDFKSDTLVNDLAILRTEKEIRFGVFVGPACLPFRFTSSNFLGQTVTALGPRSEVLRKVDLHVTSNSICARENSGDVITPGHICTYAQHKDACKMDSGGPLFWMDTSRGSSRRLQLLGVVSYGLGCASELPGVNTRVTSYIPWIVSRTPDANFCMN
ncbi:hypothetical protein JTB14_003143 [Gonioctena quinquepunctata]|nr:hypothetical protein JTB14_003143 [Gonioctena quinquepunctata]